MKITFTSERTLSTGQILRVGYIEDSQATIYAEVGGRMGWATALNTPKGETTHYATIAGKAYGILASEIKAAEEALAAAPQALAAALRGKRESLAAQYKGLMDDQQALQERAWDREDEAGAFRPDARIESDLAAVTNALHEFDAAHPEVLAAIKAEHAETAERAMWS